MRRSKSKGSRRQTTAYVVVEENREDMSTMRKRRRARTSTDKVDVGVIESDVGVNGGA